MRRTALAGKSLCKKHSLELKRKKMESSGSKIGNGLKRGVSGSKKRIEKEEASDDELVRSQTLSEEKNKQSVGSKIQKFDVDVDKRECKSGKSVSKIGVELVDSSTVKSFCSEGREKSSKVVKNPAGEKKIAKDMSDENNGHQRSDKKGVVFCSKCNGKHYCYDCIIKWYTQKTREEIKNVCPYYCGYCNCKACLREFLDVEPGSKGDNSLKLRQLRYLLYKGLPVLGHIYRELRAELEFEAKT